MKFRTDAAQEAYQEHLRVAGEQVAAMRRSMEEDAVRYPQEAASIRLTAAQTATAMLLEAQDRAVRLGTHVDVKWAELQGHLTICAQDR
ncbi:MAG: hypothetical protein WC683_01115 [bacterium]